MWKGLSALIGFLIINHINCRRESINWDAVEETAVENFQTNVFRVMADRALSIYSGYDRCRATLDQILYVGVQSRPERNRYTISFLAIHFGEYIDCSAIVEIENNVPLPQPEVIRIDCPPQGHTWDGMIRPPHSASH